MDAHPPVRRQLTFSCAEPPSNGTSPTKARSIYSQVSRSTNTNVSAQSSECSIMPKVRILKAKFRERVERMKHKWHERKTRSAHVSTELDPRNIMDCKELLLYRRSRNESQLSSQKERITIVRAPEWIPRPEDGLDSTAAVKGSMDADLHSHENQTCCWWRQGFQRANKTDCTAVSYESRWFPLEQVS